jgi:hypothetical protein
MTIELQMRERSLPRGSLAVRARICPRHSRQHQHVRLAGWVPDYSHRCVSRLPGARRSSPRSTATTCTQLSGDRASKTLAPAPKNLCRRLAPLSCVIHTHSTHLVRLSLAGVWSARRHRAAHHSLLRNEGRTRSAHPISSPRRSRGREILSAQAHRAHAGQRNTASAPSC